METYETGGKGRKKCVACSKYVGARISVCACGHEFSDKDKLVREYSNEEKDLMMYCASLGKTPQDKIVITPIDEPNITIEEITRDNVYEWADNIIDYGKARLKIYTMEALKYLFGKQVGYHDSKYVDGCKYLKEWRETLV